MESSSETPKDAPGWLGFVSFYKSDWETCKEKDEILSAVGREDIAIVVCGVMSSRWKGWLDYKSNALHGKTPKQCLKTEDGTELLKEVLMRIHT